MQNKATVHLVPEPEEALVLFEFLTREIDAGNGQRIEPLAAHEAELWALNGLQNQLERTLAEPLGNDYSEKLSDACRALVARRGSWPD